MCGAAYAGKSKLRVLLPGIEAEINDRVVLDFGCGPGAEAKEMALLGAKRVIGLDISEKWLHLAREQALNAGVAARCEFVTRFAAPVEIIVCIDSFEHFAEPDAVLQTLYSLLEPGGARFYKLWPDLVSPPRWSLVFCVSLGPYSPEGRGPHSMAGSVQKRPSEDVLRSWGWTEPNDNSPIRRASQEQPVCHRAIWNCPDPATEAAAQPNYPRVLDCDCPLQAEETSGFGAGRLSLVLQVNRTSITLQNVYYTYTQNPRQGF
jgi:SAM-dependent methyltransferase